MGIFGRFCPTLSSRSPLLSVMLLHLLMVFFGFRMVLRRSRYPWCEPTSSGVVHHRVLCLLRHDAICPGDGLVAIISQPLQRTDQSKIGVHQHQSFLSSVVGVLTFG